MNTSTTRRVANGLGVAIGRLTFAVEEDGDGFDPADAQGSGPTNMRNRLDALEVKSRPGAGTAIVGSVPVETP